MDSASSKMGDRAPARLSLCIGRSCGSASFVGRPGTPLAVLDAPDAPDAPDAGCMLVIGMDAVEDACRLTWSGKSSGSPRLLARRATRAIKRPFTPLLLLPASAILPDDPSCPIRPTLCGRCCRTVDPPTPPPPPPMICARLVCRSRSVEGLMLAVWRKSDGAVRGRGSLSWSLPGPRGEGSSLYISPSPSSVPPFSPSAYPARSIEGSGEPREFSE